MISLATVDYVGMAAVLGAIATLVLAIGTATKVILTALTDLRKSVNENTIVTKTAVDNNTIVTEHAADQAALQQYRAAEKVAMVAQVAEGAAEKVAIVAQVAEGAAEKVAEVARTAKENSDTTDGIANFMSKRAQAAAIRKGIIE